MTQSELLTRANQCHSLDNCYSFLTTLAQNYCKNNISANDLTDLASLILITIPKKALKKSQIKVFNQILDKQHVYTLSKAKKVLFSYALKEQTTNLTKIKDNTKDYYLKFENIFNYYKANHSEPKTIVNKLKKSKGMN